MNTHDDPSARSYTRRMTQRSMPGVFAPLFALSVVVGAIAEPALSQVSADRFEQMPARSIGPVGAIGQISAIDAVVSDPNVVTSPR